MTNTFDRGGDTSNHSTTLDRYLACPPVQPLLTLCDLDLDDIDARVMSLGENSMSNLEH
jgi:hypothetical protein